MARAGAAARHRRDRSRARRARLLRSLRRNFTVDEFEHARHIDRGIADARLLQREVRRVRGEERAGAAVPIGVDLFDLSQLLGGHCQRVDRVEHRATQVRRRRRAAVEHGVALAPARGQARFVQHLQVVAHGGLGDVQDRAQLEHAVRVLLQYPEHVDSEPSASALASVTSTSAGRGFAIAESTSGSE